MSAGVCVCSQYTPVQRTCSGSHPPHYPQWVRSIAHSDSGISSHLKQQKKRSIHKIQMFNNLADDRGITVRNTLQSCSYQKRDCCWGVKEGQKWSQAGLEDCCCEVENRMLENAAGSPVQCAPRDLGEGQMSANIWLNCDKPLDEIFPGGIFFSWSLWIVFTFALLLVLLDFNSLLSALLISCLLLSQALPFLQLIWKFGWKVIHSLNSQNLLANNWKCMSFVNLKKKNHVNCTHLQMCPEFLWTGWEAAG